jgi:nucleoside-diphosphate-sugar epimerase
MTGDLTNRRILVTGATGFIGGHLTRRLHAEGAHVIALEHTPGKGDPLAREGIAIAAGDITNRAQMAVIIAQDVEIVMHIAAWLGGSNPAAATAVNVDATRDLAELSAEAGARRFVFTSSIAVYGPHGDADVDESTPTRPFSDPYGDSKIAAEAALHAVAESSGLEVVIVRPGMVYGPGSPGWTVRLARWAKRGWIPLIDGGTGTAYPIYIDDLIDLLILAAVHPAAPGGTFNAVDDGPVTLGEFLGAYMRMAGTRRALRPPGWIVRPAAALIDPFVRGRNLKYIASQLTGRGQVSNQRAKDALGWGPKTPLDEGLARGEAWLRAQGYMP